MVGDVHLHIGVHLVTCSHALLSIGVSFTFYFIFCPPSSHFLDWSILSDIDVSLGYANEASTESIPHVTWSLVTYRPHILTIVFPLAE